MLKPEIGFVLMLMALKMASHFLWPLDSFDWQVFHKGWSAEKLGKNSKRNFQAAPFNKYHARLSAKRRLGWALPFRKVYEN